MKPLKKMMIDNTPDPPDDDSFGLDWDEFNFENEEID